MSEPSAPFDLRSFAALGELRLILEKKAFTPSPAVAQLAMGDAQAGGPAGPGGPGGPPPGPPGAPPMDPAAMGGAPPGMPPGAPPGPGGPPPSDPTTPPPDAGAGGPPDPMSQLMQQNQQILQMLQQNSGGGAPGAAGKPNHASIKFEPAHMHQLMHDMSNMKSVMTQIADAMGLQVPATALLQQPAPAPASTQQPTAGAPPGGAPAAPAGPAPLAVQLPSLPPVAAKAARSNDPVFKVPDGRLLSGRAVRQPDAVPGKFASIVEILNKKAPR